MSSFILSILHVKGVQIYYCTIVRHTVATVFTFVRVIGDTEQAEPMKFNGAT